MGVALGGRWVGYVEVGGWACAEIRGRIFNISLTHLIS